MIKAKVSQAQQANKNRLLDFPFQVGQQVRLSTLHWRRDYKSKDGKWVVKFMPRFDGPYEITKINPTHSTVTLNLPRSPDVFPVFHTSEIMPFIENAYPAGSGMVSITSPFDGLISRREFNPVLGSSKYPGCRDAAHSVPAKAASAAKVRRWGRRSMAVIRLECDYGFIGRRYQSAMGKLLVTSG